ncbi:SusC/RagA family TonB-linked outer membrane protein [Olleya sp. ITB9]|uniref:SusC/RagA family TonB-linked outer membrane protein n=1 Tax=Olleya sp. ITB9 TaxID=1715648 RepID=UPI0006CF70A2|nr:SusC/RagA family TonB-linked outer membrane protein [Olleya sp. ITB9]
MKTKFSGILTLFLAFVVQISFAQDKTVSGVVTDENGLPLPTANVVVVGTSNGTSTDFDGGYSINISLAPDNQLEEVLVIGYGTSTKQAFAGTATTISSENLEAKSFANVTQALAGEVAGVTVINTSGQPGTVATVRVRGYGSPLGNRSPLYVVDGIPYNGVFELNSINPSDIKSTTVLKDATATAIYGSRGANGVVLITTKTGSRTDGYVEVDFKSGVNMQIIPRYDVITNPEEYIGYVWEGLKNRGQVSGNPDPAGFANSTLFTDDGIGAGYNMWDVATAEELIDPTTGQVRAGVNRLFTPERYADIAFGTGIRTESNVRIGGGSEKSKYFASVGYYDEKGYSINSDFKRVTARLNLDSDVKDWLNVGVNIGYSTSKTTNNGQIEGSENIFEFADKMAPIYPVYARFPNTGTLIPDNIYGGYQFDYGSPTGDYNGFTRNRPNANLLNPIGSATLDNDLRNTQGINGNISMKFKISDDLSFENTFGGQYSFFRRNDASNHVYGTGANTNGNLTVTDQVRWTKSFLQLLKYNAPFSNDRHSLEILAAHESFESSFTQSRQFMQNVIVPGIYNLSNYLETAGLPDGYENASAIESYFGKVDYNFDNTYFLTGSVRTDGSSRFVNDQWGVFGSIGAAWIVSNEEFLQDSFMSYLKVKASYGITGDQQGVSTTRGFDTYNSSLVGGELALDLNIVGNPDLTWETSKMIQGGLEMSFGNYLDVNLDYYRKNTDNLFFNQRVGPSAGISSIRVNDGEILNAGLEFDVTGHIVNTKDFKLDLSVNGEVLNNEMKRMPIDPSTGVSKIIDSGSSLDSGLYAFAEGRSMFDFWMREWAGVDPSNGSPLWYQYYDDANNNGVLDAGEESFSIDDGNGNDLNTSGSLFEYQKKKQGSNIKRTVTDTYADATQVFIDKSFIPDLRGALRLSARYKNFDLSTQFTYSIGGYAYDAQYAELMSDRFGAAGNNYHTDISNRWQNPGDITDVPILSDNAIVNGTSASTRFITSTDYLALNNARIGYTLPSKMLDNIAIDALNFWVSGDNLFIKSAREGFNPSINETGNSERRTYAPPTTITLGARIKF